MNRVHGLWTGGKALGPPDHDGPEELAAQHGGGHGGGPSDLAENRAPVAGMLWRAAESDEEPANSPRAKGRSEGYRGDWATTRTTVAVGVAAEGEFWRPNNDGDPKTRLWMVLQVQRSS